MPTTRYLAVKALYSIFSASKKPKETLDDLSMGCDRRDRAFLMELVYGVVRYRDYLDWLLKHFLKKGSLPPPHTLNNLRVALYQILFMRVPEWALVNEAVEIEKELRGNPPLVNAVIRTILRQKGDIPQPSKENSLDYISITTSHPRWLVKRWITRFGAEEALRLAEVNNSVPPLVLRAKNPEERERLLTMLSERKVSAQATLFSPVGIIIWEFPQGMALRDLIPDPYGLETCPPEKEIFGGVAVQDEAAQLVTYLLNPSPGERVLDAAAAPGGKTTHIAQMMEDTGEVVAVDVEERRLRQLRENVERLGLRSIRILHADARELSAEAPFDRILLDAPCSGLGVIRRNPDTKYRHRKEDLQRFHQNQLSLLSAISNLLKPGGVMVYSVCSTEPEEGEEVIRAFLQERPHFSMIKGEYEFLEEFEAPAPGEASCCSYRTFPHTHNMDGFFAARLKRNR